MYINGQFNMLTQKGTRSFAVNVKLLCNIYIWVVLSACILYKSNALVYPLLYYLIYLTLHWPFLFNLRMCSLSINSYEYSCHTIWAGLFNALFIWLIYGKVAQWLTFRALNHDIMGSNPTETVYFFNYFFVFMILIKSFLSIFLHIFHVFTYFKSLQCTFILHHI